MDQLDFYLVTEILGYIALALLFISFQINHRKGILGFLIAGMVFLATHQFLLGAYAGAAANGLSIARNLIFRYKNDYKVLNNIVWPYLFSTILLGTSLLFWQGWYSILPAVAVIASTFALWSTSTRTIRFLSLIGPTLWLPYAIIIESTPTLLIQIVIISSIVIAIFRFDRKKL
jgi:hypothetical protein